MGRKKGKFTKALGRFGCEAGGGTDCGNEKGRRNMGKCAGGDTETKGKQVEKNAVEKGKQVEKNALRTIRSIRKKQQQAATSRAINLIAKEKQRRDTAYVLERWRRPVRRDDDWVLVPNDKGTSPSHSGWSAAGCAHRKGSGGSNNLLVACVLRG